MKEKMFNEELCNPHIYSVAPFDGSVEELMPYKERNIASQLRSEAISDYSYYTWQYMSNNIAWEDYDIWASDPRHNATLWRRNFKEV